MRSSASTGRKILVAVTVVSGIVLAETAVVLADAGFHADATATLTPADEGLWIRAAGSLIVLAISAMALGPLREHPRHPILLVVSAVLLALSVCLLAFDIYWWWAGGSYVDTTNRLPPKSLWKSYPVMGAALAATPVFALVTALLARPVRTMSTEGRPSPDTSPGTPAVH
jgi:hypothetical protein